MQSEVLNYAPCSQVHGKVPPLLTTSIDPLADEISARLEYLRRNATLDFKTGLFYLPSPQSETYLQEFFKSYLHFKNLTLISVSDKLNIPLR